METTTRDVLGALGVGTDEERIYRALLVNPGSTTSELRQQLAMGHHRLRRELAELERKAIVTRRSGSPARYQPAPPDIVVEALISAREDELNQARLDARELTTLLRTPPEQVQLADLIEILTSREAAAERWVQLQRATRERLEVFVRPPYGQQRIGEDEAVQRSLLDRGIATVGIYDQDALRHPGMLEHIGRMTALGERARVVSRLPVKLALFDRRVALVPLTQPEPHSTVDAGVVVHESALLDALIAMFDLYWQRGSEPTLDRRESEPKATGAEETSVLTLLAAGLKDQAIARQLGVSTNTVRRRITALLHRLGVTTRFQAGLALGRRGWPATDTPEPE
ncbi:MAG: helix-turn-helix transcriptional regulator [Acidimicrobiales bacterium]